MTENEIINQIVASLKPISGDGNQLCDDEPDYEESITESLRERLPDDSVIQTCATSKQLGALCCPVCHDEYPELEMEALDSPDGGKTPVCWAIKSKLFPLSPAEQAEADEKLKAALGMTDAEL